MKLIKTTKSHLVYILSDKESRDINGYKYLAYLKANYTDYKPSFKLDSNDADFYEDDLKALLNTIK